MYVIYQYNAFSVYEGVNKEIGDAEGCPMGWTPVQPPIVPEGKFAYFRGPDWIIIDEYPGSYPPPEPPTDSPINEPPVVA